MAAEVGAFFGELAVCAEGEHLKAAAVGEDRTVPSVEFVQATGPADDVHAGTEIEVICVAKDNLGLYVVAQFVHVDAFHGAEGADGHEDGGFYGAVVGRD